MGRLRLQNETCHWAQPQHADGNDVQEFGQVCLVDLTIAATGPSRNWQANHFGDDTLGLRGDHEKRAEPRDEVDVVEANNRGVAGPAMHFDDEAACALP